ncbi:hypothetical protein SDC9_189113 [bioreactor metagenome]|uniref:Uncharacterized protein n=1 Tax=bioreactor metagenome TaxID=1076179 RepID=A0A645HRU2_9ZZZZ
MVDLFDLRVSLEVVHNLQRIGDMPLYAERERLNPLQNQEGVEG